MSEATATTAVLKKTPLNETHRRAGAKMVDFGGWDMPVQYSGVIDEHNTVRNAVGLFDVSHMGEIEIRGPEALALVNYVSTNNAAKLNIGRHNTRGCCMSMVDLWTISWSTRSPMTTISYA